MASTALDGKDTLLVGHSLLGLDLPLTRRAYIVDNSKPKRVLRPRKTLIVVVSRHQGEEWRRQVIDNYLNDTSDAGFTRLHTIARPLPDSHHSQMHGHRGQPPLTVRTSMQVSGSNYTRQGSLPALTYTTSASASAHTSLMLPSVVEQRTLDSDGVLQLPLPTRRGLECPFNLLYCTKDFADEEDWVSHSLTHFSTGDRDVGPPKRNNCCFCDTVFESDSALESWGKRMQHVRIHHHLGHGLAIARPDFELFKYLYDNRLIDDAEYKDLKGSSKDRNAEYCDLKGFTPSLPQTAHSIITPPTSPQSPRSAVTVTYSPSRERHRGPRRPPARG